MKFLKSKIAFTLIELLVVITIIAILASIALPVFTSVKTKGNQTKALSNAKQIVLGLRLYASDNNGSFPAYTYQSGAPTTTTVPDSNTAFAELFPTYCQDESIFYTAGSAWTPTPPDNVYDTAPDNTSGNTLKTGENTWAYVTGLNDSSNPSFPLIADGFAGGTGVNTTHTYTVDATKPGGVWKGKQAIVVRADSSGSVMPVNAASGQVKISGPDGTATPDDMFTTGQTNTWLGEGNVTLNPKGGQ